MNGPCGGASWGVGDWFVLQLIADVTVCKRSKRAFMSSSTRFDAWWLVWLRLVLPCATSSAVSSPVLWERHARALPALLARASRGEPLGRLGELEQVLGDLDGRIRVCHRQRPLAHLLQ